MQILYLRVKKILSASFIFPLKEIQVYLWGKHLIYNFLKFITIYPFKSKNIQSV